MENDKWKIEDDPLSSIFYPLLLGPRYFSVRVNNESWTGRFRGVG
jgi:hypothetical protein